MKNNGDKTEMQEIKFDLKTRLIAISEIRKSRKSLQETIEKGKWLGKYIQPAVQSLFSQEDILTGDIVEALDQKKITIEDIERISAY